MYIVKEDGKKITRKQFKNGFATYESARAAVKRLQRERGQNPDLGFTGYGYRVEKKSI